MIHFAERQGRQHDMFQRFFRACFTGGLDVGDYDVLARPAAEIGLDRTVAREAPDRGAFDADADVRHAGQLGVTGVPFFVFDGQYAVSGAQPVEAFLQALDVARKGQVRHERMRRPRVTSSWGPVFDGVELSTDGHVEMANLVVSRPRGDCAAVTAGLSERSVRPRPSHAAGRRPELPKARAPTGRRPCARPRVWPRGAHPRLRLVGAVGGVPAAATARSAG
ncbi:DsbA family protein [Streptomyces sp. NPDC096132]|uniref:DsbA family oxidoreductase n=1 Tax=Streptomyces sp. NPDC096132 TaxID=3366075 RepID=UPI003816B67B